MDSKGVQEFVENHSFCECGREMSLHIQTNIIADSRALLIWVCSSCEEKIKFQLRVEFEQVMMTQDKIRILSQFTCIHSHV